MIRIDIGHVNVESFVAQMAQVILAILTIDRSKCIRTIGTEDYECLSSWKFLSDRCLLGVDDLAHANGEEGLLF